MNKEEIKKILPHRDAMLLVDEAVVEGELARGKYHITGDEWFLQGHFPGNPVVPGVILCEMLAQAVCVLMPQNKLQGAIPYFSGLKNVRFKNPVKPGDTLETECKIVREMAPFVFAEGKGYVNGKLCISAEFSFAILKP